MNQRLISIILFYDKGDEITKLFNTLLNQSDSPQALFFDLFTRAFDARGYQCVSALLKIGKEKFIPLSTIEKFSQLATQRSDGHMVLLLENNNYSVAAKRLFNSYFPDSKETKSTEKLSDESTEALKKSIMTLLRFMPVEKVNKLIEEYAKSFINRGEILMAIFRKEKATFYEIIPYVARYYKHRDLRGLSLAYKNNMSTHLHHAVNNDLKYGADRKTFTNQLFVNLSKTKVNQYIPTKKEFLALAKSSKRTHRVAALLEKIAYWNIKNQYAKQEDFITVRTDKHYETPIAAARYLSAWPLVLAVSQFSQSEIQKYEDYYELFYKIGNEKIIVNNVHHSSWARKWEHGRAPINATWGRIEDVFEKIWSMNLKKPSNKKLTQFYSLAAELVWLIGNTQPMHRGSGTVAEIMLALVHMRHGFKLPMLKTEFPQLDVLDITFPLSDYKFFFTYFFEPSTIPEHLRFSSISSALSVEDQIKELYQLIKIKNPAGLTTECKEDKLLSTSSRLQNNDMSDEEVFLMASFNNDVKLIQSLLNNKVNPYTGDKDHNALLTAVYCGYDELTDLLFCSGGSRCSNKALYEVVGRSINLSCFEIEDSTLKNSNYLLVLALKKGNKKTADVLIKHGADINRALFISIKYELVDAVKTLLAEYKSHINFADSDWNKNLLSQATKESNPQIIKILLEAGAEPNLDLLWWAIVRKEVDIVKMILATKKIENIDAPFFRRESLLCQALREYKIETVNLLLDAKADPNFKILKEDGCRTPLHVAVWERCEMVETLFKRGAKLNEKDSDGLTPLESAVSTSFASPETIKFLLDRGAQSDLTQVKAIEHSTLYQKCREDLKSVLKEFYANHLNRIENKFQLFTPKSEASNSSEIKEEKRASLALSNSNTS